MQKGLNERIHKLYDMVVKVFEDALIPREEYLKVKTQNVQSDFQCISTEEDVRMAEMILFQAIDIFHFIWILLKVVKFPKVFMFIETDQFIP